MLKFDKLKLISNIENISTIDEDAFDRTIKNDSTASLKFNITTPYLLYIEVDFWNNELVIEFSGKVLGKEYKKLISIETIRQCFENINSIGVCTINVEALLYDAVVVKCDVTQDIICNETPAISSYIRSNIANYNQYSVKQLRNGNLVIEKNVTTRQSKKRLTIYNKNREMNRAENKRFMNEYNIPSADFDNVCRFEMNLNSMTQIKSALVIPDTGLLTVLSASNNPIRAFLDDVVADVGDVPLTDKQTYFTALVLRDCNYDLAQVEAKMRQIYSKGTNLSKIMKPYREALACINPPHFTKQDLLQMIQ